MYGKVRSSDIGCQFVYGIGPLLCAVLTFTCAALGFNFAVINDALQGGIADVVRSLLRVRIFCFIFSSFIFVFV